MYKKDEVGKKDEVDEEDELNVEEKLQEEDKDSREQQRQQEGKGGLHSIKLPSGGGNQFKKGFVVLDISVIAFICVTVYQPLQLPSRTLSHAIFR